LIMCLNQNALVTLSWIQKLLTSPEDAVGGPGIHRLNCGKDVSIAGLWAINILLSFPSHQTDRSDQSHPPPPVLLHWRKALRMMTAQLPCQPAAWNVLMMMTTLTFTKSMNLTITWLRRKLKLKNLCRKMVSKTVLLLLNSQLFYTCFIFLLHFEVANQPYCWCKKNKKKNYLFILNYNIMYSDLNWEDEAFCYIFYCITPYFKGSIC